MDNIEKIFKKYESCITGKIGLGFKNLKTGEEFYLNGDVRFPSASVFKIPVLIELFSQAKKEDIFLDDIHVLKEQDKSIGSGVLAQFSEGASFKLRDAAKLMMTISDNTGTDIIFNKVGKENIQRKIKEIGLKNTRSDLNCDQLVRKVRFIPEDIPYKEANEILELEINPLNVDMYRNMEANNNYSSPKDLVQILSMLFNKELVDRESSEEMLEIMYECTTNDRIPKYLPKGTKVAHKTGTLSYVCNDSGIVNYKDDAYILSIFINGIDATESEKKADDTEEFYSSLSAKLSRDIFDYVVYEKQPEL